MNETTEYMITTCWASAKTQSDWEGILVRLDAVAFCQDDPIEYGETELARELLFLIPLAYERRQMAIEEGLTFKRGRWAVEEGRSFKLGMWAVEASNEQWGATMNHSPTLSLVRDCYYTADGEAIHVPCLDWLEDGRYFDEESEAWLACSRYYIGTGDNEDGSSVWLNDDMVEVQP